MAPAAGEMSAMLQLLMWSTLVSISFCKRTHTCNRTHATAQARAPTCAGSVCTNCRAQKASRSRN